MKKLAFALVCVASLAFFASCVKEGQPTIQVLNQEGYVQNGATVEMNEQVDFGFVVASSAVTNKELTSLVVDIDGTQWANVDLTGKTEYTYTDHVTYEPDREIIGTSVITAIVTDAAGQTATATITLNLNEEQPLIGSTFEWVRDGSHFISEEDMRAVGLTWPSNSKAEAYVNIKPLTGCSMYIIEDGNEYDEIATLSDKEAFFADLRENGTTADVYRGISAWDDETAYNSMLAVIDAAGEKHLVHFTYATVKNGNYGTKITISGELK
jgi:hypothetical protein